MALCVLEALFKLRTLTSKLISFFIQALPFWGTDVFKGRVGFGSVGEEAL